MSNYEPAVGRLPPLTYVDPSESHRLRADRLQAVLEEISRMATSDGRTLQDAVAVARQALAELQEHT